MTLADHARLGIEAMLQGRFAEADQHLARAEQALAAVGQADQSMGLSLARARLALLRGDRAQASRRLQQVEAKGPSDTGVLGQIALLQARLAEGQPDAAARLDAARAALSAQDPQRLQGRLAALNAALPAGLPDDKRAFMGGMVQQLEALAQAAQRLQLAWLAYQAGDSSAATADVQAWLAETPAAADQATGYLLIATGLEINGHIDLARVAAERARAYAVQAIDAALYKQAAWSLCRLAGRQGDRLGLVQAAGRALQSLEALEGEGAGRIFEELLHALRADWGEAAWQELVQASGGFTVH